MLLLFVVMVVVADVAGAIIAVVINTLSRLFRRCFTGSYHIMHE